MDDCFAEPDKADPTPAQDGETTGQWLARSTWQRAGECRRFYNVNLGALPIEAATELCGRLRRERSQAAHFELVVGRFLQLIGAVDLRYEVTGSEGRSVDWTASFADGHVNVEATAPVVNSTIATTLTSARPVVELVVELAPRGWHPIVFSAPVLAKGDRRRLRQWLTGQFAAMPPRTADRVELETELTNGRFKIALLAASDPDFAPTQVSGPGVGYIDNTSAVVHRAVAGKRVQARGASGPTLAAIYTGGFGDHELEDFDIALFGRTVEYWGEDRRSFDPSGVFGSGVGPPKLAGALAFAGLGWRGGPDPVLYLHPRFDGQLPRALLDLRLRELTAAGIVDVPARQDGRLMLLGWPKT